MFAIDKPKIGFTGFALVLVYISTLMYSNPDDCFPFFVRVLDFISYPRTLACLRPD